MEDIDIVSVNLRTVAQLKRNQRLDTRSKYFTVDQGYWYMPSWVYRTLYGESRTSTIEALKVLFNAAQELRVDAGLLHGACEGLKHMRETYASDSTTLSQIDHLISIVQKRHDATQ